MIRDEALALVGRVLAPLAPDRFFADILGREVTRVDGDAAHPRAALLGPDPRTTILAAWSTHPGLFGFHADGVTGPPPPREGVDGPDAFARLVAAYHARGYTVHVPKLEALSPALARFMRALEYLLHQPVKASLFWSRPGNRAPVHYDDRDNITIQLVGAKCWYVSSEPPSLHNGWRGVAEAAVPLGRHTVLEMRPGQLLFLPRGLPHTVETLEESLHLSVTMLPVTVRDATIAALDHLSDYDRALRETALTRSDLLGAELGAVQAQVVRGLERLLEQARAPGFVASALQRRASRMIAELPKLPPCPCPAALSADTRLAHADGAMSLMLATPDAIDFAQPGMHLIVHRAAEQALRFVAATPRFRIGEIPALADDLRLALVERLLASGYLRADEAPATAPPA